MSESVNLSVSQTVSEPVSLSASQSDIFFSFFLSLTVYERSSPATNLHQLIGEALQYSVVDFPWVDEASDGPDFYLNAVK